MSRRSLGQLRARVDELAARHVDLWPGWPALLLVAAADGSFSAADQEAERRAREQGRPVLRVVPPPCADGAGTGGAGTVEIVPPVEHGPPREVVRLVYPSGDGFPSPATIARLLREAEVSGSLRVVATEGTP